MSEPVSSVDHLLAVLATLEAEPGDEVVFALDHLLQTAEALAQVASDDEELVAAGLVHDLAGGLHPEGGDHARTGAELVGPLLGSRVAALVAAHVDAKRYLVAVEPDYGPGLSAASTASLAVQGGPMSGAERRAFGARPDYQAAVALRRADDAAKVPGAAVRPLGAWEELLRRVAASAGSTCATEAGHVAAGRGIRR